MITINLLRDPFAALCGARFLAYQYGMSSLLRAARFATESLTTVYGGTQ